MNWKILSLSALMLGTACVTTSAFAQLKEPELQFHPAKAWTVGQTTNSANGKQGCAVQSEFNNGFVLQFDGNNEWIQAFTINFRQEIFTPGQTYDVTFNVPGKASKVIKARAETPMLLTTPMKGQKELYKAAKESSVVDIAFEGNSFRFYLVNFAPAANNFEKCMAGATFAPSTGTREAAATGEGNAVINESIALEDREATKSSVNELTPEEPLAIAKPIPYKETYKLGKHEVTKEQLEGITRKPVDVAAQNSVPNAPKKRMSEQLAAQIEANPKIADADADFSAESEANLAAPSFVHERLNADDVKAVPPTAEEPGFKAKTAAAKPQKQPEPLLDEPAMPTTEDLLKPVDDAPVKQTETKNYKSPEMKVNKSVSKVEADFTDFGAVEPASDDAPFSQFEGERKNYNAAPRDPDMARKVSELEDTVSKLKKENVALNDELKGNLRETEQERLSISSENWNLESATMRFNEAERQVKKLGEQVQRERAQCAIEKKDLEGQLFDPRITEQQQLAKLSQLEQELAETQRKLEDQRIRYEDRIKTLEGKPSIH